MKQDKAVFAMLLVRQIRRLNPPGRFLKLGKDNRYSDIGDKKAIEKTSQALREGARAADELQIQTGEIVVEKVSHAACKLVQSFTLIDKLKNLTLLFSICSMTWRHSFQSKRS